MSYFSAYNKQKANKLFAQMSNYYKNNSKYYLDIAFSNSNWSDHELLPYQSILGEIDGKDVLELGCGNASVLSIVKEQGVKSYTGTDFSEELIRANRESYPFAYFEVLNKDGRFIGKENSYDVVFSVFVLEHCIRPFEFLLDCSRFCRDDGKVIIICPDFASRGLISSQSVGLTNGSGREKLKKGRILDAFLTAWTTRITSPLLLNWRLRAAHQKPVFLLNGKPSCLTRPFYPDADAVYVTQEREIVAFMSQHNWSRVNNDATMSEFCASKNLIYMEFKKAENNSQT